MQFPRSIFQELFFCYLHDKLGQCGYVTESKRKKSFLFNHLTMRNPKIPQCLLKIYIFPIIPNIQAIYQRLTEEFSQTGDDSVNKD